MTPFSTHEAVDATHMVKWLLAFSASATCGVSPAREVVCSIPSEVFTRAMTRYTVGKLAYGDAANKYVAAEQQTQSVRVVTLSAVWRAVVLPVVLPSHLATPQNFILFVYTCPYIYSISTRDTEILI